MAKRKNRRLHIRRVRTPTVIQMEAVECGAAALGIILGFFGRHVPLEALRVACGVSRDGCNAANIVKAAERYGLLAEGYKVEPEMLESQDVPLIAFWEFNHFVVLEGVKGDRVFINDPATGPRTVPYRDFNRAFTGVVLVFSPGPKFQPGKDNPSFWARLKPRMKGSGAGLSFLLLVGLLSVIPGLVAPFFSKIFVDDVLVRRMDSWVLPLLWGMGLTAGVHAMLVGLRSFALMRLETGMAVVESGRFFMHLLKLPIPFFAQRFAGDIGHRVQLNDGVARLLSGRLLGAVLDLFNMVFFLGLMAYLDLLMSGVGILIASSNLLLLKWISRKRVDENFRLRQEEGKLLGMGTSGLQGMETLKASGAESDFFAKWAGHQARMINAEQHLGKLTYQLNTISPVLTAINSVAILGIGGFRVMDGLMSVGTLVAFQSLMSSFLRPVNHLVSLGGQVQDAVADLTRLDDVMAHEPLQGLEFEHVELSRSAQQSRRALSSSFQFLSQVAVQDKRSADLDANSRPEALLAACQAVGKIQGVEFKSVPPGSSLDRRDPLGALCRASRIKMRYVALKGEWWRGDQGPLLGFRSDGGRPVALIPDSSRGYQGLDPITGSTERITVKNEAGFERRAVKFYRPLPEAPLNLVNLASYVLRSARSDLVSILVFGLCVGALGMAIPLGTRLLFDTVLPSSDPMGLVTLCAGLLVFLTVKGVYEFARNIALLRVEGRVDSDLQAALWDRLVSLPVPFFRRFKAGDLSHRAMGISTIRKRLTDTAMTGILSSIFSVFNLLLLFFLSFPLALVATGLVGLTLILPLASSLIQLRFEQKIAELEGKIGGMVFELIRSIAKLRVAGAEYRAFHQWAHQFGTKRRFIVRARTIQNWFGVWNAAFPILATATLFWAVASGLDLAEGMSTGTLLAFLAAFAQFQSAALGLAGVVIGSLGIIPLYERLKPILTETPEVHAGKTSPGRLQGEVDIRHVCFQYHAEGERVLNDVSLKAAPGEFVAIVGPSGSGKSTLVRLMLGFEKVHSGSIFFDGKDSSGVDMHALRRQLGVVLQHSALMSASIYENIVGALPLSMHQAWEAACMAGLKDDIQAMPMGMYTRVSEGGGTLSGGQRQRILLARALVSKPRILILDEATSALDNKTQATVRDELAKLNSTRIVIAHRLSTIQSADRIYVLERGVIRETGTFDELLAAGGLFARLARRQMAIV